MINSDRLKVAYSVRQKKEPPLLGLPSVEEFFYFTKINFVLSLCLIKTIILALLFIRFRCNTLLLIDLSGKMTMRFNYIQRCQSYFIWPIVICLKFWIKWRGLLTLYALGKEIKRFMIGLNLKCKEQKLYGIRTCFGKEDVKIPPFDPNMRHLNHFESYGIICRTKLNIIIHLLFGSNRVETNQLKNAS